MRLVLFLLLSLLLVGCGNDPEVTPAQAAGPSRPREAVGSVYSLALHQGWNPVAFRCTQLTEVKSPQVASLAFFDGAVYQTRPLVPQELNPITRSGFWAYAQAPTTLAYSGVDDGAGNVVTVRRGWNLVGFGYSGSFPASSLTATLQNGQPVPLASVVLPLFYQIQPDNRYTVIDVRGADLLAGDQPCWIFASDAATLRFSSEAGPRPSPVPSASPPPTALGLLNSLRELANVPPVGEDASLNESCVKHANWMLLNGMLKHGEDAGSAGYTADGDVSGQQSNLSASHTAGTTVLDHVGSLMVAPFHGVGFLDPRVSNFGIGYRSDPTSPTQLKTAVAINVVGDRQSALPSGVTFPILWPAPGKVLPYNGFDGLEYPTPLPGLTPPFGCPLIIQTGSFTTPPSVSTYSLMQDGVGLQPCFELDETNYSNPEPAQQALGRAVLQSRNAIILLPAHPLVPGATYTASVTNHGQTITWSFTVAPQAYIPRR